MGLFLDAAKRQADEDQRFGFRVDPIIFVVDFVPP